MERDELVRAREHLRQVDPVMRRLIDASPDFNPRAWLDELPPMDGFKALIFQVIGQQISLAATRAILQRMTELFGGTGLPSPEQMLACPPEQLRAIGISRRKSDTLMAIAERFAQGRLSDGMLERLSDGEVEAELTAIPGVGPWTVHGFLIIALDRPDVILPGDVALQRAVQQAYQLDHRPDADELVAMAEAWRPYRTVAVAYLFGSLFGVQTSR